MKSCSVQPWACFYNTSINQLYSNWTWIELALLSPCAACCGPRSICYCSRRWCHRRCSASQIPMCLYLSRRSGKLAKQPVVARLGKHVMQTWSKHHKVKTFLDARILPVITWWSTSFCTLLFDWHISKQYNTSHLIVTFVTPAMR